MKNIMLDGHLQVLCDEQKTEIQKLKNQVNLEKNSREAYAAELSEVRKELLEKIQTLSELEQQIAMLSSRIVASEEQFGILEQQSKAGRENAAKAMERLEVAEKELELFNSGKRKKK
ncbi:hypothetical protein FACS1894202_06570 [Clostridia bacterium]|nr:hypothetical protein FACS1894202_06570 [Clostridia bacterium]